MSTLTVEQVTAALATVDDPEIHRPITELGMVDHVAIAADGSVDVRVLLTVAGCPMRTEITQRVTGAVGALAGVGDVRVELGVMTEDQRKAMASMLRGGRTEPEVPFAKPESLTRVYAIA